MQFGLLLVDVLKDSVFRCYHKETLQGDDCIYMLINMYVQYFD